MACKSAKPGTEGGEAEGGGRVQIAEVVVGHVKEPELYPKASEMPPKGFKHRSNLVRFFFVSQVTRSVL